MDNKKKKINEIRSMTAEEIERLENNIGKLKEKEKRILALRYGLDGENRRTIKEVHDIVGLSESSIIRIEKKALNHLKMIERRMPYDETISDDLKSLGEHKKANR